MNAIKLPHWANWAGCLAWLIASNFSDGWWFVAPHQPWYLRMAAVCIVLVPAVYVYWTYFLWDRTADEYQKLLGYRAIFQGVSSALLMVLLGHWVSVVATIFPVVSMPAWMTLQALSFRRMLDRQT